MINLMPDATENEIEKIEKAIEKAPSISEMLDKENSLEEIAQIVTGDENVKKIEDNLIIGYRCDCSKEKFEKGLISLGKEEIQNMIEEDGMAETKCHFCNTTYLFTKEDLEKLIN